MENGSPDVTSLIRAARAGRGDALERLLALYRNYLTFLARNGLDSTLGAKADASDVAQNALLLAFERFPQFRGETEAELVAWLRRILARCLAMLIRHYRGTAARDPRRERAIEGALDRSSLALGKVLPAPTPTPSQAAVERERCVILADAMADLGEDQREVIELRSLRQLDWATVATEMGRSPEAARKLWTRALQKLGQEIVGKLP
ncbi:MAG: sigma-70 family RNA polymerase sigma factor [Planctomycetota bacterium]|jgi:RNA polymerase sigma-70 factor (ECF subfamily)